MTKKIRNFRDLDIRKKGREIVGDVYSTVRTFPKQEQYELISQIRRSSVSIPSNIAEGLNRLHNRGYRQLLYIALGSCAELETLIEIATDLGYMKEETETALLEKPYHESRMLSNLIKKIA